LLFSECDDEGWEVRKVEMFRDGRIGYAGGLDSAGGTVLGERPTPDLAEITNQAEFDPTLIARREFEKVWSAARAPVPRDLALMQSPARPPAKAVRSAGNPLCEPSFASCTL
jgi:hypothetical protein